MGKNDKTTISPSRYYDTQKDPHGFKLYVRETAQKKMDAYVRLVPTEIGWMGFIKTYDRTHIDTGLTLPSVMILEDVFLYDQEVSGGSVDSGHDAKIPLGEVLEWIASDECEYSPNELRFFGHSHVNMGAYHSATDTGMIDDWGETGLDWCVSHVQNKRGEVDVRFEMFTPYRISCPVDERLVLDQDFEDQIVEEIATKVTEKKWGQYGGGWKGNNWNNHTSKKKEDSLHGTVTLGDNPVDYITDELENKYNGSVNCPIVRVEPMSVKFSSGRTDTVDVRKEIVQGIIIHCAITNTPAARERMQMTNAERVIYYQEFREKHPDLFRGLPDPTQGQLEMSRSIQRSAEKRTSDTKKDEQPQTQNQSEVKSDSKDVTSESKDKKSGAGSKDNNKKKQDKPQLKEVEDKETVADDESVEEQVKTELEKAGYDV